MKNLERVQTFDGMMPAGMALAAARLDIDAARAEGYRQGVEDSKSLGFLKLANSALKEAKRYGKFLSQSTRQWEISKWENNIMREIGNYQMFAKAAFNGATGPKRAEIRQRLERMNDNG